MDDEILTIHDVAARLKLAERTVYAMAAEHEMPAFKVRGQWRIRRSDFERWLDAIATGSVIPGTPPQQEIRMANANAPMRKPDVARDLPIGPLTERCSQEELHSRFIASLGKHVSGHSTLTDRPLALDLLPPLPSRARLYIFNATRPPGGRPLGEHKIQLIMPRQRRGERGSFDNSDGRIVFLAGYTAEEDVFILWDAGLYADFAWSRNVQVKAETILAASAGKIAGQDRHLRHVGGASTIETVLAAPATHLVQALRQRVQLTRERMARD